MPTTNDIPSNEFVTDTMGLVLHLERRFMPARVKTIFSHAETKQVVVYIPGLVLAEILYLSEKRRIQTSLEEVRNLLIKHEGFQEYPVSFDVVEAASKLRDIPELHDRLIAATARHLNRPVITNDPAIQASDSVLSVWE